MSDDDLTPEERKHVLRYLAGSKSINAVLSSTGPDWLIEGWLTASATVVDGPPESGKSSLVVGMAAAIATGQPWLGVPISTGRTGPVIVIVTDPGDASQWAKRGHDLGVPEGAWELVEFNPRNWDEYEELAAGLESRLVVFDNITGGVDGPINDADPTALLAPLKRIANAGTPVAAIAHSGKQGGRGPMGPTAYTAWRRHGINVSRKDGRQTIRRTGNFGDWPNVIVTGIPKGSAVSYTLAGTEAKSNRDPKRLDSNAAIARWIVENCQGVGVNDTGRLVAEKFGGTPGARQTALKPKGPLHPLLKRTGSGGSTAWELNL